MRVLFFTATSSIDVRAEAHEFRLLARMKQQLFLHQVPKPKGIMTGTLHERIAMAEGRVSNAGLAGCCLDRRPLLDAYIERATLVPFSARPLSRHGSHLAALGFSSGGNYSKPPPP